MELYKYVKKALRIINNHFIESIISGDIFRGDILSGDAESEGSTDIDLACTDPIEKW
tara:strand:- start:563 stop:733 length:171 start_codon:yes stop_codon:yes gene_type:complete